ncbi:GPP34 family phosphoprotein [Kitasatospora sp. CM 4170]|uniref:GPP34 family phosphoprotein n=1 Tax=Kitasatospora aburaviensis TaxID=67265 RepID=A0ABW1EUG9_9ACTN|nr:GPP34 family phosphoprotein [Kitasatospora sp. CM 4170]WNM43956.1 GPP34 family phosphoprotein [Kitasatospora sp. CM 4170]
MPVTLGEEVMLLSLDDESGQAKDRWAAGWTVTSGLLLELTFAGSVRTDGGRLEVVDLSPTGLALLDGLLERIAAWTRTTKSPTVAGWLMKDQGKSVEATLASLCERGIVTQEQHRMLGLFPVRRYPEADGAVERELRGRLARVVLEGAEPDGRTSGLIALLHGARLHRLAFPDLARGQVVARMAEIADGQWAGDAVRDGIRATQAALGVLAATAAIAVVS